MILVLVVVGCGSASPSSSVSPSSPAGGSGLPTVVASTSIWADVVANVACDGLAAVEMVIPTGGDPHGFEPSLDDRARMESADLIVANGLFLEEGLADTIDAAERAGTPVLRMAEHLSTIPPFAGGDPDHGADEDSADDEDGAHDGAGAHEGDDPHVWFDPVRVSAALPALAAALVDDGGLDPGAVQVCLDDYLAELATVDGQNADTVAALPENRRVLVTNHDTLGYFADRYGFEIIGTIVPAASTLATPGPARMEALAKLMAETGVPAVFVDSEQSTADAEALAARVRELGGAVEVVTLFTGTLGPDGSDADTYLRFLGSSAEVITRALADVGPAAGAAEPSR